MEGATISATICRIMPGLKLGRDSEILSYLKVSGKDPDFKIHKMSSSRWRIKRT